MDAILEAFRAQLQNEFFSGGAMLVVLTAILALMRNVPTTLWVWTQRQFITTIDVADHDPAFYWIQKWLGEQSYTKTRARLLTVSTRTMPVKYHGPDIINQNDGPHDPRKRQLTEVVFSPAPGRHLIRFRGHFILLTRTRDRAETAMGDVAYHEAFEFRSFSREVVRELIHEARETAFPPEDNRIAIMKANYNGWRIAQRRPPRLPESVVLYGDQFESMRSDLEEFFKSRDKYMERGIPYQRGYLFEGAPGNGKTSTVIALASLFDRDIYILQLAGMHDNQLATLMSDLPEHAFVLIEDVDCVYEQREGQSGAGDHLTFSGFINAIDGVCAPPGRILFMTTNHPEKLDAALIRPGRIDRKFNFCNADARMASEMFRRFFPETELAEEFGRVVGHFSDVSMAALQEYLLANQSDPRAAIDRFEFR